jgi:hypothetical protein
MAFKRLRILLGLKADPNAIPRHATIGRYSKSLDRHSFFTTAPNSRRSARGRRDYPVRCDHRRRRRDRRAQRGDQGRSALRHRRRQSGAVHQYRFSDETIAAMLKIRWWDWPIERLMQEKSAFDLPAEEFVTRFLRSPST